MSKKQHPRGFVAECQCGIVIGVLGYGMVDRREREIIIGIWMGKGCKIVPRFDDSWRGITCNACRCDA